MTDRPLLACMRCGAETRHTVEFSGLLAATVPMCKPCFEDAAKVADEHRQQFDALIAGGMTNEQANAVMIDRIDGKEAS